MSVTASFGTPEEAARRTHQTRQVEEPSLLRDPVLPFIVVGLCSLVTIVILAYVLTAPGV